MRIKATITTASGQRVLMTLENSKPECALYHADQLYPNNRSVQVITHLRPKADDAKVMWSSRFSVTEICRWFGVPLLLKVAGSSKGASDAETA